MGTSRRVAVVGSGLAGTVLAMYLARRGHEVTVLERLADPRLATEKKGRSLNLTLTKRGLDALDPIGALRDVVASSVPVPQRVLHELDGRLVGQPYDDRGSTLFSISRHRLNNVLLTHAERHSGVKVRFQTPVADVDLEGTRIGDERFDAIFGADGAFSAVRLAMQRRRGFDFVQEHCGHANVELRIDADSAWNGDPRATHIWPRNDVKLIGFPNPDKSFSLSFHLPADGPNSAAALFASGRSRAYFEENFPDVAPYVADLEQIGGRVTEPMLSIKCAKWYVGGRACLVGDAAHALFPFAAGQGANSALEDGMILNALLGETRDDFDATFRAFHEARKPAMDALCDLTLDGYRRVGISLAIATANPVRERLRAELRTLYPAIGHSLYANIAFTHHPYHVLIQAEAAIDRAIDGLASASTNPLFVAAKGPAPSHAR